MRMRIVPVVFWGMALMLLGGCDNLEQLTEDAKNLAVEERELTRLKLEMVGYRRLGLYTEALSAAQKAFLMNPDDFDLLLEYCALLELIAEYETLTKAQATQMRNISVALLANPLLDKMKRPRVLDLLARSYVESDVPRPAFVLDILDKELKNYPNNSANLRLGWFFCSKRYQETNDVTDLNKGIELIEIALPALEEGRRKSGFTKALEQWKRERDQVEMERFDAAMQSYKERNFEESVSRFQVFLQSFPKSKLADDALFWMGESFLSLRHYDKAISAYQEAMDKYPEGDRLPNAMLRQALAFDMKEDKISSRLILKDILGKYPQSNEADVARQRLKE